eukprot:1833111-Rhodomonas_salina.6
MDLYFWFFCRLFRSGVPPTSPSRVLRQRFRTGSASDACFSQPSPLANNSTLSPYDSLLGMLQ